MGYYCTVPQCTSLAGKTKNVKFHRFPRDISMADKWNTILKRGKPYTKYSKVCSLHFTHADYNVTTMGQWKTLSKDAVPSQNLPKLNPDGTVMVIRKSRTIKYKEAKIETDCEKFDRWPQLAATIANAQLNPSFVSDSLMHQSEIQEDNLAYRLQMLNTLATNLTPHELERNSVRVASPPHTKPHHTQKPKKDATMQTDPLDEEEIAVTTSYSEASDGSVNSEHASHSVDRGLVDPSPDQQYGGKDCPDKYGKVDDYIPQTNEEYNTEAERYALERKRHIYEKVDRDYQKITHLYPIYGKQGYDGYVYPENCRSSAEMLRNQQHNLEILQRQHLIAENQNFFNDHIKRELEDDKYVYEPDKGQMVPTPMYEDPQELDQQNILDDLQCQVKQEPDLVNGCTSVLPPQGSPYYPTNVQTHTTEEYTMQVYARQPGAELLIAKQNALAAHAQLWQNTSKRPFFYSETHPYAMPQAMHRYEDMPRILQ